MFHLLATLPLAVQGFTEHQVHCQRFLNLRYDGTDVPIMTPSPEDGDFAVAFEQAYQVGQQGSACHSSGGFILGKSGSVLLCYV